MKTKIVVFVCLFFGIVDLSECQKVPFELDEYLNGVFVNRGFNGVWISDTEFYYTNRETRDVMKYRVATHDSALWFSNSVFANFTGSSFTISPDQNFVLIRYNLKAIFRHSIVAQFIIHDLTTGEYHSLAEDKHLHYAAWSSVGNSIAYVFENNIYYVSSPANVGSPEQITTDGVPDVIYNGIPDWVYEEEVFGSGSAIWWSPDGGSIAFAHFDDTEVEEFTYFLYGDVDPIMDQYPELVKLRYPKVGTRNPDFELRVVSFDNPSNVRSLKILPDGALSRDYVLFDVTWATNSEVVAVVENRIQNEATIRRCKLSETTCAIENEYKEANGWLEMSAPKYNADGTKCLMLISQPVDTDSYIHLVMFDTVTKTTRRLTEGARVVTSLYGWDEERNMIYYAGSLEGSPQQQHVYYMNLTSGVNSCISCSFANYDGYCRYASASFSKQLTNFAQTCQAPGPTFVGITTALASESPHIFEDNNQLRAQLSTKLLPQVRDYDVTLPSGFVAKARMLLPPDFDATGLTKYPMVVNVYGGPDSNQISDRFSLGFENYIVTNRRYIYCYIDGRGSGRKGDNMRFQIYKRMATVEIEDQIAVARALRDNYSFIDGDKIGIWGWSYGGFATAWALVQDVANVFKFGLSVAPVTDFTLYDTIYTERYMGLPTPETNQLGYNNTDLTRKTDSFRDKSFFLIHGNADDNVHYQQSMLLAKALEHADVMFYQMSYPDENHSLGNVYPHLYHTIDRYWARCFGLPDPRYKKLE